MKGNAVSEGIAIGRIYALRKPVLRIRRVERDPAAEVARLGEAIDHTVLQLQQMREKASGTLNEDALMIFDAHLLMATDPEFRENIENMIRSERINAEYAVKSVGEQMAQLFEALDDDMFQERAEDIRELAFRLNCSLMQVEIPDLSQVKEPVIIAARDLLPADITELRDGCALGFMTEFGGRTGHGAILARTLEIPAVVGVNNLLNKVHSGEMVILDALAGEVILHPSEEQIAAYTEKQEAYRNARENLSALKEEPSVTEDGIRVEVAGNIGSLKDVDAMLEAGAEGIGLFRTEFLFMESENGFPGEEEQFEVYRGVVEKLNGKQVVFRTCDIGADKQLSYYKFEPEANPALGCRAIRFSMQHQDIFRTQLRAMYRASAFGNLGIMFPMIATVDEFCRARAFAEQVRDELIAEGITVAENVQIGCMIEVPSAVFAADKLSRYADFFSIGTNDLIQYAMAADRIDSAVAYLYQPLNPAVLRMVKMTIDGAHRNGRVCRMCGEMAGDSGAVELLLGMGLDEFSVSAGSVLSVRNIIRHSSYENMRKLAEEALELESTEEIEALIRSHHAE